MADYAIKLFYLYASIAFLYLIHTGIDIPFKIDDWFRKNHHFIYLAIGTLYIFVSFTYLDSVEDSHESWHQYVKIVLLVLLVYIWYQMITRNRKQIAKFRLY